MKRIISLALCLSILCTAVSAFALPTFEMSLYSENSELYNVDVDSERGVAFIETSEKNSNVAFTHKYESDFYYSTIRNDILVIDYYKSSRYPVVRTWIDYRADKALNIYAVSFVYDGKTYTFSDVADKDRVVQLENGVSEQLLIKYGSNNSDFFVDIAMAVVEYGFARFGDDGDSEAKQPEMKMILHGTEDVVVDELPTGFWNDLFVIVMSMMKDDYLQFIRDNEGTPCKVK